MDSTPPSGEQIEIFAGDQRVVIVEVGGGLRTVVLEPGESATAAWGIHAANGA
jgi:hypothetical protein